ncbi:hypothetical protein QAD02_018492 [Eretmocerus hayati]|uniref:Uncharacterized protein n=1 Tax=Eretmocerus hayati TaxID=131215 RepID=A0ACC2PH00_9HYME|nr:hypothetical protein QAD02_018492 [Eretmocerus hayati]
MGHMSLCYMRICDLLRVYGRHSRSASSIAQPKNTFKKEKPTSIVDKIKIDEKTIAKLEKISLVDFGNEAGIRRLESAVVFAQKLWEVQLDPSVKPLYTVLENEKLELREDQVNQGNCRNEILKNAKVVEDEYFVAPLGNAPKSS